MYSRIFRSLSILICVFLAACWADNPLYQASDTDGTEGSNPTSTDPTSTTGADETGEDPDSSDSSNGQTTMPPTTGGSGESSGDSTGGPDLCGNGMLDNDEQCDDPKDLYCIECVVIGECGDGIVQNAAGEQCDPNDELDDGECNSFCKLADCGDGRVDEGEEECDDQNNVNDDECTNTCELPECGDGIIQSLEPWDEQCDDGDQLDANGCTAVGDETCPGAVLLTTPPGEIAPLEEAFGCQTCLALVGCCEFAAACMTDDGSCRCVMDCLREGGTQSNCSSNCDNSGFDPTPQDVANAVNLENCMSPDCDNQCPATLWAAP